MLDQSNQASSNAIKKPDIVVLEENTKGDDLIIGDVHGGSENCLQVILVC